MGSLENCENQVDISITRQKWERLKKCKSSHFPLNHFNRPVDSLAWFCFPVMGDRYAESAMIIGKLPRQVKFLRSPAHHRPSSVRACGQRSNKDLGRPFLPTDQVMKQPIGGQFLPFQEVVINETRRLVYWASINEII